MQRISFLLEHLASQLPATLPVIQLFGFLTIPWLFFDTIFFLTETFFTQKVVIFFLTKTFFRPTNFLTLISFPLPNLPLKIFSQKYILLTKNILIQTTLFVKDRNQLKKITLNESFLCWYGGPSSSWRMSSFRYQTSKIIAEPI